jgi:hypothetical protein
MVLAPQTGTRFFLNIYNKQIQQIRYKCIKKGPPSAAINNI